MSTKIFINGLPNLRIVEVDGGWQVQRRTRYGELWYDVDDGHFSTAEQAVKEAPELCGH